MSRPNSIKLSLDALEFSRVREVSNTCGISRTKAAEYLIRAGYWATRSPNRQKIATMVITQITDVLEAHTRAHAGRANDLRTAPEKIRDNAKVIK